MLVFSTNDGLWDHQSLEFEDCDCAKNKLLANSELMCNLLLQQDAYKSMETNGIHSRVLKDLTDVTVSQLEAGRCGPKRPDKITEVVVLENTGKHLKDNAVIGCSQHGFTMGKFRSMNFL